MKSSHLKIALGQILIEGGEPERNFQRAQSYIKAAAEKNCDLIVLPECMDFGWTHPSALKEAQPIPGKWSNQLIEWAKEYKIGICAGLTEKSHDENYNSALLIDANGKVLIHYRKINLLEVEFPFYSVGSKLEVADSPWGKVGVNICSDNYIDAISVGNCLGRMGARVILSPSSWTVEHSISEGDSLYEDKWLKPYSTLSKQFSLIVIGVTSVGYIVGGPYEGKKMIGQSLVVGPNGPLNLSQVNEFAGSLEVIEIERPKPSPRKGTQIGEFLKQNGWPY